MNFIARGHDRGRLGRLADHDLGFPVRASGPGTDAARYSGMLTHHVILAEIARHPAPAIHVGDDDVGRALALLHAVHGAQRRRPRHAVAVQAGALLELLHRIDHGLVVFGRGLVALDLQALAQQRHARIVGVGLELLAVRNTDDLFRRSARRGRAIRRAWPSAPCIADAAAGRSRAPTFTSAAPATRFEDFGGSGVFVLIADVVGDARVMHAAGRGVPGIFQHFAGHAQFGFGERVDVARLERRHRIIGRLEPVGIDILQIERNGGAARRLLGRYRPRAARNCVRL